ncbi:MAG: hypothetical protein U0R70_14735 [Solirubrobacteraceae bacterium]
MTDVYGALNENLSVGDIIRDVTFVVIRDGEAPRRLEPMHGLVMTGDCELDKYWHKIERGISDEAVRAWPVTAAPLRTELDGLEGGGLAGDIRRGRVRRYFHIPAAGGLPEFAADLWFAQPVPRRGFDDRRAATLSRTFLLRLFQQDWETRTRIPIPDVFPIVGTA